MNRLGYIATRMGPDLRDAIEAMPGLGGLALWVKFLDSDDPEMVACTDGVWVKAGPLYEEHTTAERRFIILHELLHVGLSHPARARAMMSRVENFDERLYNISCDAIINTALDGVRGAQRPKNAVTLKQLLECTGQWKKGDLESNLIRQWSSEALYHLLVKNRQSLGHLNKGFSGSDLNAKPGRFQGKGDHSTEDEIRIWNVRLKMAQGALSGILDRLVCDLPKINTPWERVLRDFLFRHTQRKRKVSSPRPSRRWLALEHDLREREGVDLPFECATAGGRCARMALAVDTSGSIDEKLLNRFAAEVAAILEKTEPLLRLIVCDASVHQTYVIWNLIEIPGKSLNNPFGRLRRFNFVSLSLCGCSMNV